MERCACNDFGLSTLTTFQFCMMVEGYGFQETLLLPFPINTK